MVLDIEIILLGPRFRGDDVILFYWVPAHSFRGDMFRRVKGKVEE